MSPLDRVVCADLHRRWEGESSPATPSTLCPYGVSDIEYEVTGIGSCV
eukprot:CAMPEP_0181361050 /NCGR_PEP_ID=MMETSP1106-20121128/7052_1 /TAXON_ID=81844 /ORGANISM="Mantoniella antarctica, Strain SL-175" /LENGTH=47 /DNA_ID= /DNA_START= /DNA_END= /DNA_ORIENTATION=